MLRVLICQGVYYFMYLYMCVLCTMLRVLICQGVYYFVTCVYIAMCVLMCVYYVKSVSMSRSPLFHIFYMFLFKDSCCRDNKLMCSIKSIVYCGHI